MDSVFDAANYVFALSVMGGKLLFLAFVLYAVGQTFYWPTVLGFVAEQFPKGGAMTLNTVSAMGLLTVGIFGFPFLGAVQDSYKAKAIMETEPAVTQAIIDNKTMFVDETNPEKPEDKLIFEEKKLFGVSYNAIVDGEFKKHSCRNKSEISSSGSYPSRNHGDSLYSDHYLL